MKYKTFLEENLNSNNFIIFNFKIYTVILFSEKIGRNLISSYAICQDNLFEVVNSPSEYRNFEGNKITLQDIQELLDYFKFEGRTFANFDDGEYSVTRKQAQVIDIKLFQKAKKDDDFVDFAQTLMAKDDFLNNYSAQPIINFLFTMENLEL